MEKIQSETLKSQASVQKVKRCNNYCQKNNWLGELTQEYKKENENYRIELKIPAT